MERHRSNVPGKDSMFCALHELGADPPSPVRLFDRELPRLRDVPGKCDQHASDHLIPAINGDQMDLLVFTVYIQFGKVEPQGQSQDPIPQLFLQGVFRIVCGYPAIEDHRLTDSAFGGAVRLMFAFDP